GIADRRRSIARVIPLCTAAIIAIAFLGTADRLLALTPLCMGNCRDIVPYDRLAEALRHAGFRQGAILSPNMMVIGNLKRYFPNSVVGDIAGLAPGTRVSGTPIGQCLLIWRDQNDPSLQKTRLAGLHLGPSIMDARTVEIPFRFATVDTRFHGFRR